MTHYLTDLYRTDKNAFPEHISARHHAFYHWPRPHPSAFDIVVILASEPLVLALAGERFPCCIDVVRKVAGMLKCFRLVSSMRYWGARSFV